MESCSVAGDGFLLTNFAVGAVMLVPSRECCGGLDLNFVGLGDLKGMFSAPGFVKSARALPKPLENLSLVWPELLNLLTPSLTGVPGDCEGDGDSTGVGERAKA